MTTPTPSNPATEAPLQSTPERVPADGLLDECHNRYWEAYHATHKRNARNFGGHDAGLRAVIACVQEHTRTPPPQEAPAPVRAVDVTEADVARAGSALVDVLAQKHWDETRRVASGEDRDLERAIEQRDDREEVIDEILDLVLGTNRREWSSMYDYADAIEDVKEALSASPTRAQAASAGEPVAYINPDSLRSLAKAREKGVQLCIDCYARPTTPAHKADFALYAAPTDVAAYREVTVEDAMDATSLMNCDMNLGRGITREQAMFDALKAIGAIIRITPVHQRRVD